MLRVLAWVACYTVMVVRATVCPSPKCSAMFLKEESQDDSPNLGSDKVVLSPGHCAALCLNSEGCTAFTVNSSSGNSNKSLASNEAQLLCNLITESQPNYGFIKQGCKNGGTLLGAGNCSCLPATTGLHCENIIRDCSSLFEAGEVRDGLYYILPEGTTAAFPVRCYLKYGGWTFLLQSGSTACGLEQDFNRSWQDYKVGFGNFWCGGFWLGNNNIHLITSQATYRADIVVRMQDAPELFYMVYYDGFRVDGESSDFRVHVGTYVTPPGHPAGDALHGDGDPTLSIDNMQFATFDHGNSRNGSQCATLHHTGWWFNDCAAVILTGQKSGVASRLSPPGTMRWTAGGLDNYTVDTIDVKVCRIAP